MDDPYPDAQIEALLELIGHLRGTLPNLRAIAGHEDLDTDAVAASDDASKQVRRKLDPGPMFPWPRVLEACGLRRLR
jgi:N-acetylmuramoyl-L-alanine amidase